MFVAFWPAAPDELGRAPARPRLAPRASRPGCGSSLRNGIRQEAQLTPAHPLGHEQGVTRLDYALHADGGVLVDQLPVGLVIDADLDRAVSAGQIQHEPADPNALTYRARHAAPARLH